jgi:SAM-dependent methyltransferase
MSVSVIAPFRTPGFCLGPGDTEPTGVTRGGRDEGDARSGWPASLTSMYVDGLGAIVSGGEGVVDFEAVKKRQQATWASGDFSRVGAVTVLVGELLCDAVQLHAGERVLDVATGSGNAAMAAARRRCRVTGIDFVPALLERARLCAAAEQLSAEFQAGDAENIPFPDATFDCVLSTFGSMFAPNQEKAASELLRVCRPEGRVGLACWIPESFVGGLFRIVSKRVPPPPGLMPPTRWGTKKGLEELFGAGGKIATQDRTVFYRGDSPEAFTAHFRKFFGPVVKAFEGLDAAGQAELESELTTLLRQLNGTDDGTVYMPVQYLEIVVSKP